MGRLETGRSETVSAHRTMIGSKPPTTLVCFCSSIYRYVVCSVQKCCRVITILRRRNRPSLQRCW